MTGSIFNITKRMGIKMLEKNDFAVLVLFYEKPDQTIECVQSLLSSGVKIYVLNNNSSLASREKLGKFCANYSQVKILDSDNNLGVAKGRNYLLNHTNEQWMLFMDNDIIVKTNDWFDRINKYIQNNADVEVFIPKLFNVHENAFVDHNRLEIEGNRVVHKPLSDRYSNHFPGGASFVSRSVFNRLGLYDDQMFIELEDCEFGIRGILSEQPICAMLIDDIELHHEHKALSSIEDKKSVFVRYNYKTSQKSFEHIAKKYPDLIFEHEFKDWLETQIRNLILKENVDIRNINLLTQCNSEYANHKFMNKCDNTINERFNKTVKRLINGNQLQKVIVLGIDDDTRYAINALQSTQIETVCITFSSNLENGECDTPKTKWLRSKFGNYRETEQLYNSLKSDITTLIIISSHLLTVLKDHRPLIRMLKKLLLENENNQSLIFHSLPNDTIQDAEFLNGSFEQLNLMLASSGFTIRESVNEQPLSYSILGITRVEYDLFLNAFNLPSSSIEYLVISEEHAKAKLTGGIGSYVQELEDLVSKDKIGTLLVGKGDLLPESWIVKEEKWFTPETFFNNNDVNQLPPSDMVLETVEQILYFYPDIKVIECQDIGGFGLRLVQGKRAGFLPSNTIVKICCHGSVIYLENNFQVWFDFNSLDRLYAEKISLELADVIHFPTEFLRKLYLDAGYDIPKERMVLKRLPFTYKEIEPKIYQEIDTLIYFGKRITHKGYSLFTEAIKTLYAEGFLRNKIKKIILLGPKFEEHDEENSFFDSMKDQIEIIEVSLRREEAVNLIESNAERALCVLPYRGDNHPFSVLEVLGTGCQILANNSGGIPELMPKKYHELMLCLPTSTGIAEGIKKSVNLKATERQEVIQSLLNVVTKDQFFFNQETIKFFGNLSLDADSRKKTSDEQNELKATLMVLCNDTSLNYIEDFVESLKRQTVQPEKVTFLIFSQEQKTAIQLCLKEKLILNYEVIECNKDNGLSVAKNTILNSLQTDILISADIKDILQDSFIYSYTDFFKYNPDSVTVTSYYESFTDGSVQNNKSAIHNLCRPLGDASMITGQIFNDFGHFSSAYRTDFLKAIGGWDETMKTMWNDEEWALFLKIKSMNKRIDVIPKVLVGKRLCVNRDYYRESSYLVQQTLARNTSALSKFDCYRLQSIIRNNYLLEETSLNHQMPVNEASILPNPLSEQEIVIMGKMVRLVNKVCPPNTLRRKLLKICYYIVKVFYRQAKKLRRK